MAVLNPVVKKHMRYLVYEFYVVLYLVHSLLNSYLGTQLVAYSFILLICNVVESWDFQKGNPFNLLIGCFTMCLLINNNEPVPLVL